MSGQWRVVPLGTMPQHLDTVGGWHREAFGKYRSDTDFNKRIRERVKVDAVPTTLLCVSADGTPVGCASLIESDMETVSYTPWLASFYVIPEARKTGASAALLRAVKEATITLGADHVYLWCEASRLVEYYKGHGYKVLEERLYLGHSVTVMISCDS